MIQMKQTALTTFLTVILILINPNRICLVRAKPFWLSARTAAFVWSSEQVIPKVRERTEFSYAPPTVWELVPFNLLAGEG